MDPFSAAVNVGSAIDLSIKGLSLLAKYYSDVKSAAVELEQFKECLSQDLFMLQQLAALYERLKQQKNISSQGVECLQALEKLFLEDPNQPELRTFYKELQDLVMWLEKRSSSRVTLIPKRLKTFTRLFKIKDKRETGTQVATEGSKGLSLPQKLRWPTEGKRKVEKMMPLLKWHRDHLTFALALAQTYVPFYSLKLGS